MTDNAFGIRKTAGFTTKPAKEQAPNALENQHLAQGEYQRGLALFDGFWLLFSIEKKLELTPTAVRNMIFAVSDVRTGIVLRGSFAPVFLSCS